MDTNPYDQFGPAGDVTNPYNQIDPPKVAAPPAPAQTMANAPTGFAAMGPPGSTGLMPPGGAMLSAGQAQQTGLATAGMMGGRMLGGMAPPPLDIPAAYAGGILGAGLGDAASQGIDLLDGQKQKYDFGQTGATMTGAAVPTLNLAGAGAGKIAGQAALNVTGAIAAKQAQIALDEGRPMTLAEVGAAAKTGIPATVIQRVLAGGPSAPGDIEVQDALKNQSIKSSQAAGYVFPAAEQGKGGLASTVESVAGSADLRRDMLNKNQRTTNAIARTDLGLPKNTPITPDAVTAFREAQYQPYREVADMSAKAANEADALQKAQLTAGDYHDLNIQANDPTYQKALQQAQTVSGADIEALRVARSQARMGMDAYKSSGNAQTLIDAKAAAATAADLQRKFEAAAIAAGRPNLVPALQQARVNIAKSHVYESALNGKTGDVDAGTVGSTYSDGVPLTGGLDKIATANLAMQPYVKDISSVLPTGQSKLNGTGVAIIGGQVAGVPGAVAGKLLGMFGGRALAKGASDIAMSPWYQKNIVPAHYSPPPPGLSQYLARFSAQDAALKPDSGAINALAQPTQ